MVRKKGDVPLTKVPEGVKRGRGRRGDVGNPQHGQEREGHAVESVNRERGEA
jgi:hypothetical protein